MNELIVEAKTQNLDRVNAFILQKLTGMELPKKVVNQVLLVAEEIFVNIASYAYDTATGMVEIRCCIDEALGVLVMEFLDDGKPFDPTQNPPPTAAESLDDIQIGGLGIFMVKQVMDEIRYEYRDGKNILYLKKTV